MIVVVVVVVVVAVAQTGRTRVGQTERQRHRHKRPSKRPTKGGSALLKRVATEKGWVAPPKERVRVRACVFVIVKRDAPE